jgi:hypothetical protein
MNAAKTQSSSFKIGWWILVVLSALMAIGHLSLMFTIADDFVLFAGWSGFSLYGLAVFFWPFRQGESWAWNVSWLHPLVFLSPLNGDANIAPYYTGIAVLFGIGLLLTRSAFKSGS